jgi:hypothetical protein
VKSIAVCVFLLSFRVLIFKADYKGAGIHRLFFVGVVGVVSNVRATR